MNKKWKLSLTLAALLMFYGCKAADVKEPVREQVAAETSNVELVNYNDQSSIPNLDMIILDYFDSGYSVAESLVNEYTDDECKDIMNRVYSDKNLEDLEGITNLRDQLKVFTAMDSIASSLEKKYPNMSFSIDKYIKTYAGWYLDKITPEQETVVQSIDINNQENNKVAEEQSDTTKNVEPILFEDRDEVVYASSQVNIRMSYSVNSEKVGSLSTNQSVRRLGTGLAGTDAEGWSKVQLDNGSTAYIKSEYLSLNKVEVKSQNAGSSSQKQSSKSVENKPVENKPVENETNESEHVGDLNIIEVPDDVTNITLADPNPCPLDGYTVTDPFRFVGIP